MFEHGSADVRSLDCETAAIGLVVRETADVWRLDFETAGVWDGSGEGGQQMFEGC